MQIEVGTHRNEMLRVQFLDTPEPGIVHGNKGHQCEN